MSLVPVERYDLRSANTLGLPCIAERFASVADVATLRDALVLARANGWSLTLLGGGSNLILPAYLDGLVIQLNFAEMSPLEIGEEQVRLRVEAGMPWHSLVMACVERDWWGIENLALIPGHCGAAPIQNIGAYGVEVAEVLESVELLYLDDGRTETLSNAACAFGYRDSVFKRELAGRVAIVALTLRLSRVARPRLGYGDLAGRVGDSPSAREVAEAVCAIRRDKLPDPSRLGNAGSFFKNPLIEAASAEALLAEYPSMPYFPQSDGRVKLAAGWLIDQCGLKGCREGPYGVHDRQALVLVHHGGGDAVGLLAFADSIAGRVAARFGVNLEREPRLANE